MAELVKMIFMTIGIFTVGLMIYVAACEIIDKFSKWRKNGCKIKCLCKPHVYEIEWRWSEDGKTLLVCKKCGKKKTLFIDFDSFRK